MQIRMNDPAQYQQIVDAEWNIIYDKLAKCAESGAQIVLSRLAIGDLGTQYFADRDIFCAGRVSLSLLLVMFMHVHHTAVLMLLILLLAGDHGRYSRSSHHAFRLCNNAPLKAASAIHSMRFASLP